MQIGSVTSIPALDAVPVASATAQVTGAGLAKAVPAVATSGDVASEVSVHISTSSKSASPSSSSALSPLDEALTAVYTTAVAGHDYLGTVQQAAGEYVASAADPPAPPVTGVGASIQAAENNLTMVIDEMA